MSIVNVENVVFSLKSLVYNPGGSAMREHQRPTEQMNLVIEDNESFNELLDISPISLQLGMLSSPIQNSWLKYFLPQLKGVLPKGVDESSSECLIDSAHKDVVLHFEKEQLFLILVVDHLESMVVYVLRNSQ